MKAPQIIIIIVIAISLTINAEKHGEPRENYNFWVTLFAATMEVLVLWWGGFWG